MQSMGGSAAQLRGPVIYPKTIGNVNVGYASSNDTIPYGPLPWDYAKTILRGTPGGRVRILSSGQVRVGL